MHKYYYTNAVIQVIQVYGWAGHKAENVKVGLYRTWPRRWSK